VTCRSAFKLLCVYLRRSLVDCNQQPDFDGWSSPSENSVDSNDKLHKILMGRRPAVHDSEIADNIETKTPLHSAAKRVDSAVTDEPCLYTCDVCSRQFSAGATLRRHRRRHEDCATCTHCGHSFCSSTALRHHVLIQCPRKSVTCNICWGSFDGWPCLSGHTVTSHPEGYVCQLCGQAFLHFDELLSHGSLHSANIYQCQICSRSFCSRRRAKRHVWKHVTGNKDGCISEGCVKDISEGEQISESQMNRYNRKVRASESFLNIVNGDACIFGYSLNEIVKDTHVGYQQKEVTGADWVSESQPKDSDASQLAPGHTRAHGSLPISLPGYCLPAASNGHVDGHRIILCFDNQSQPNCVSAADPLEGDATEKAATQQRVTCAECSRTFKRLSDLHVHMRCHTGEMRYKCSVCSRPFRKSGTLARHMRIHTGERPYVCETCGKSYKHLFHLHLHMTVHSSDRPFTCDICGKAFQSATSLKKHRFVHSGVKPFSCPICARLFNRRSNMRAHMRVHDGARQHEVFGQEQICILCRKKFNSTASLQAHLQTHARQVALDVGADAITADDSADSSGRETTHCKVEKQQTEDVYIALPLVHFDDFDVS